MSVTFLLANGAGDVGVFILSCVLMRTLLDNKVRVTYYAYKLTMAGFSKRGVFL